MEDTYIYKSATYPPPKSYTTTIMITDSNGNVIYSLLEGEGKPIDINRLYHVLDGNDYNYTGYRPFSNKDYERIKGTNISYKTDSN